MKNAVLLDLIVIAPALAVYVFVNILIGLLTFNALDANHLMLVKCQTT